MLLIAVPVLSRAKELKTAYAVLVVYHGTIKILGLKKHVCQAHNGS